MTRAGLAYSVTFAICVVLGLFIVVLAGLEFAILFRADRDR